MTSGRLDVQGSIVMSIWVGLVMVGALVASWLARRRDQRQGRRTPWPLAWLVAAGVSLLLLAIPVYGATHGGLGSDPTAQQIRTGNYQKLVAFALMTVVWLVVFVRAAITQRRTGRRNSWREAAFILVIVGIVLVVLAWHDAVSSGAAPSRKGVSSEVSMWTSSTTSSGR